MGVRILVGDGKACLYCSTTDWAFGPLVYGDDAGVVLERFIKWLPKDARTYSDGELERLWCKFLSDISSLDGA